MGKIVEELPGLYGVSAVCSECTEKCKQWKQVKVCRCKFFRQKGVKKTV
jgi:hypothetical protein